MITCRKFEDVYADTVVDIDGNTYSTVKIGTQVWMGENLKTTRLNDGTSIQSVETDCSSPYWGSSNPQFCWYDNNINNKSTYGGLYNFGAVKTAKLCPIGWHLPSDSEWQTSEMSLGMTQAEAQSTGWRGTDIDSKMKSSNGWIDGRNGTNSSGFNALPSGFRWGDCSGFAAGGAACWWWSTTEFESNRAWCRHIEYDIAGIDRTNTSDNTISFFGNSIRCIKD